MLTSLVASNGLVKECQCRGFLLASVTTPTPQPIMGDDFASEYASSLSDLSVNSKPLINMLTMLAEENAQHAPAIVQTVERHLLKVKPEVKLPVLYLVDSIVKNIGGTYLTLFTQNIVSTFCAVFEKVDEKTRASMFKLRQTWNEVFPSKKLYAIDVRVNAVDPAWPITAPAPTSIHVNPRFLKAPGAPAPSPEPSDEQMREELLKKRLELLELQQQKIRLELLNGEGASAEAALHKQKELLDLQTKKVEMEMELLGLQARHRQTETTTTPTTEPTNNASAPAAVVQVCIGLLEDCQIFLKKSQDTDLRNVNQDTNVTNLTPKTQPTAENKVLNKAERSHRDPRLVGRLRQTEEDLKREEKNREVAAQLREQLKDLKEQTKLEISRSTSSVSERAPSKNNSVPNCEQLNATPFKETVQHDDSESEQANKAHFTPRPTHSADTHLWGKSHPAENPPLDKIERKGLVKFKGARNVRGRNEAEVEDSPMQDVAPVPNKGQSDGNLCHDVDLRPILSPSKNKRSADVGDDEPGTKRTREELMNELFGKEDVDLRQLPGHKKLSEDRDSPSQTSWAKYKEKNQMSYLPLNGSNSLVSCRSFYDDVKDIDMRPALLPTPTPSEVILHSQNRSQTDGLGRPLLYVPLPEDPSERRRSLLQRATSPPLTHLPIGQPNMQHFDMRAILAEAQEQVAARMLSLEQYDMLLQQVAQLEQLQHLREVQQLQAQFHHGNDWTLAVPPGEASTLDGTLLALAHGRAPSPLVSFDQEKQLQIDGVARVVRFYGDAAIVFLDWDDPRDLTFEDGVRTVIIDERFHCPCALNDAYREYNIDGRIHQLRLGVPTRELCIDGTGYECFFGGDAVRVTVGGKQRAARLEGPPPIVRIGETRRSDLVIARMQMLVDEKWAVPVFLDAQAQRFELGTAPVVLQFADALQTLILNDRPYFGIQFGGPALPVELDGQPHTVRFPPLPRDVVPGQVRLKSMLSASAVLRARPVYRHEDLCRPSEDSRPSYEPALPIMGTRAPPPYERETRRHPRGQVSPTLASFDLLSSLLPPVRGPDVPALTEYHTNGVNVTSPVSAPTNIAELYNRLVAAGLLPSTQKETPSAEEDEQSMNEIDFSSERFKTLACIKSLYRGIQCSACGIRFPTEQAELYGPHLDWHFRKNKREKDTARRVQSRRWFYAVSDWIQYEEIEDLEERARSWFEQQQEAVDQDMETPSLPSSVHVGESEEENRCAVCYEPFEQFYHRDLEEWHLRDTVRVDGHTYHPACFEDYQASLASGIQDMPPGESAEQEASIKPMPDCPPGLDLVFSNISDSTENMEVQSQTASVSDEIIPASNDESQLVMSSVKEESVLECEVPKGSPEVSSPDDSAELNTANSGSQQECTESKVCDLAKAAPLSYGDSTTEGFQPPLNSALGGSEPVLETSECADPNVEQHDNIDQGEPLKPSSPSEHHIPKNQENVASVVVSCVQSDELMSDVCTASVRDSVIVQTVPLECNDQKPSDDKLSVDVVQEGTMEAGISPTTQQKETSVCSDPNKETSLFKLSELVPDTTKRIVSSGIDGNVELEPPSPCDAFSKNTKIRINLAVPIKVRSEQGSSLSSSSSLPESNTMDLDKPITVRPIDPLTKPRLVGRKLTELPPKLRGKELSGLCTIM